MRLLLDTHIALWAVLDQPLPSLHGDPFDRLLLAQAVGEGLALMTHDCKLALYGEPVIAV